MASISATAISISARPRASLRSQGANGIFPLKSVSFSSKSKNFLQLRSQPAPLRLRISCAAKPETVDKVCEIVKKKLALADDIKVTGESKFATLGADSLDTVEIVMDLEENFGINVEEDSANSIVTVQDAANLIEDLVNAKSAADKN
ncbi:hypothetical protein J5N97_008959 [Dioscorea zingiberensis]|uniref:Acyl carrier protein n=1 Tax=Dioscorea zingiberensis TaxID=325984 RepID=A0A9D5HL84_9LILI|nr:hypothetical protein J5N97_008959 [Dioscorea zingiberensis]